MIGWRRIWMEAGPTKQGTLHKQATDFIKAVLCFLRHVSARDSSRCQGLALQYLALVKLLATDINGLCVVVGASSCQWRWGSD